MNTTDYSYIAGAIDCDGYITVKCRAPRKDSPNFSYKEEMGIRQTNEIIPRMLHDEFGGTFRQDKPQTENSKPMWSWRANDKKAFTVCKLIYPYLKIKSNQANCLFELRETKNKKYYSWAYWFEQEFPEWRNMELITTAETANIIGYSSHVMVCMAINRGTLLGIPVKPGTNRPTPRVPRLLAERIKDEKDAKNTQQITMPPQLIEWRESIWQKTRELNKIGVHGTQIYHKTGPYKRKNKPDYLL